MSAREIDIWAKAGGLAGLWSGLFTKAPEFRLFASYPGHPHGLRLALNYGHALRSKGVDGVSVRYGPRRIEGEEISTLKAQLDDPDPMTNVRNGLDLWQSRFGDVAPDRPT